MSNSITPHNQIVDKESYDIALRPLSDNRGWLDDVVVNNCDIHLEQMDTDVWSLICYPKKGGKIAFNIMPDDKEKSLAVTVNFTEDLPDSLIYEQGGLKL